MAKSDSLYNYGMKVLAFSTKKSEAESIGWHRVGTNIGYFPNAVKKDPNMRNSKCYYTFTFTYEFEFDSDQVYFAHCFPYTYSDLTDDLSKIEKNPYTSTFFVRNTLCRTLAGNKCEYLTITSKSNTTEEMAAKKGVFISARVHPGESNASWMMKGVIEFLVSDAPEARILRDQFVFKILPMINPDGVINGNYRCSLAGSDLNRRYKNPSKVLYPVIYNLKRFVKNFSKERELMLFCDLHGHSRKKSIFMYGNNIPEAPESSRLFPYIMSKLCDYFSFEDCRFSMHKSKEATARIAIYREVPISNIFTMEASFSGADHGEKKGKHFTTEDLMAAGRNLLEAILVYSKVNVQENFKRLCAKPDENKKSQKDSQSSNSRKGSESS